MTDKLGIFDGFSKKHNTHNFLICMQEIWESIIEESRVYAQHAWVLENP